MKLQHVRLDQNHMATTFSFTVSCAPEHAPLAKRVLEDAHAWITRLEFAITEFKECSAIYRLNRAAPGTRVQLTREGIDLLERAERMRTLTGGAFDCAAKSTSRPAIGPGFAWDTRTLEAWRLDAGVQVGFGAIGKGFALDGVRGILERAGFKDYLLSAGGSSLILSGFAGPGDPWRWGWSWSKDRSGVDLGIPFEHSRGAPVAIGISGTHEKGRHLLDPRTAAPAPTLVLSSLVSVPSATEADALSTALFVAGYEKAAIFMAGLPYLPAMAVIGTDGVASWNGIFKHYWGKPRESAPRPKNSPLLGLALALALGAPIGLTGLSAHADELSLGADQVTSTAAKTTHAPKKSATKPKTVATARKPANAAQAKKQAEARAALEKAAAAVSSAAAALDTDASARQPAPVKATAVQGGDEIAPPANEAAAPPMAQTPETSATAPDAAAAIETPTSATSNSPDATATGGEEAALDLADMSENTFAPYVTERSFGWIVLPILSLALVLLHLKKIRRNTMKKQSTAPFTVMFTAMLIWSLEQAHAVDLLPISKALIGVLGTPKAFKKSIGDSTFFYSKNAAGKADQVAFIEHNTWQKSCTHTWIVGVGPSGKVTSVVAQEQQCPHAKPAAANSFLEQYKGKGPADLAKLKDGINTVAKATGSCELATDAVIHAVKSYQKIKGQI